MVAWMMAVRPTGLLADRTGRSWSRHEPPWSRASHWSPRGSKPGRWSRS